MGNKKHPEESLVRPPQPLPRGRRSPDPLYRQRFFTKNRSPHGPLRGVVMGILTYAGVTSSPPRITAFGGA